jgi:hypothetical protein
MPPMFPSRPHTCIFLEENPKPNTHLDLYPRPLVLTIIVSLDHSSKCINHETTA